MPDALTADQYSWAAKFCGIKLGPAPLSGHVESHFGDGPPPPAQTPPPSPDQSTAPPPADPAAAAAAAAAAAEKARADQGKADIAKNFKVQGVADNGATWKSTELQTVTDAFTALPAADRDVLRGVSVERVPSIDATHAAQFNTNTSFAEGSPAQQTNTIQVGDSTFDSNGTPVPASEQTRVIVHEVGHAVSSKAQRAADLADAKAGEAVNTANDEANAVITDRNAAVDAFNDAVNTLNDANAALQAARTAQPVDAQALKDAAAAQKAANTDFLAKKAVVDTLTSKLAVKNQVLTVKKTAKAATEKAAAATRVPAKVVADGDAAVQASATAASAAAQTAGGTTMTDQETKDSQAYRDASAAVDTQLTAYQAAITAGGVDPDDQDKQLAAVIASRAAERDKLDTASKSLNPALAAFLPVDQAQDDLATKVKTRARLPDRALPVQHFVEIVEKNHITPDTQYARDNWPFAPEEFFAEAYSLWRINPQKLQTDAKPLYDWFQAGKYH